jgi:hypothetical protein
MKFLLIRVLIHTEQFRGLSMQSIPLLIIRLWLMSNHRLLISPIPLMKNGQVTQKTGLFTGGALKGLSIGPYSRAIKVENNNVYKFLSTNMNRTLWQIDDYVIDVFDVESPIVHQYDYPLNVNGEISYLSAYMTPRPKDEALGTNYGYRFIKELSDGNVGTNTWESKWIINNEVSFKTTMLGGDNTQIITGKGIGNDTSLKVYDKNHLIARRKESETAFVSILEPSDNNTFRNFTQHKLNDIDGKKVYAFTLSGGKSNYSDTFVYSKGNGVKRVNQLSADAESAFFRTQNGEDIILAYMNGSAANGSSIGVSTAKPTSLQLTKLNDKCYRLDMGEKVDTKVSLSGLDGYKIYKMALSDEIKLTYLGDSTTFDAVQNGIYIVAADNAQENMEMPFKLRMGTAADLQTVFTVTANDLSGTGVLIEAEDVQREKGGNVSYIFRGGSNTTANIKGSSIYNWNNKGHIIQWTFNIPKTGKYKLGYSYATLAENSRRLVSIDGGTGFVCEFNVTAGWNDRETGVVLDEYGNELIIELEQGEHTLAMENVSGTALNLDYIKFIEAE